ncbi:hypothetical protein QAD02_002483 [Eretmocerus hayati]|uniref:Uncharacterized protein n=1 Tax=Eretmocerus hayati TaxID=131215 RepID=A0ACC2NLP9_9HYME|nr:hypothetical protein QAD02_002483 [Eretmocerus hayati]
MSDNLNERTSHGQLGSQLYIENGMQSQMIETQQPPNSNTKRLKNSMEHHSEDNILQSWKDEGKRFRCRICHEILNSRSAYSDHVRGSHPSNEVLREFVDPSDREVKGSI